MKTLLFTRAIQSYQNFTVDFPIILSTCILILTAYCHNVELVVKMGNFLSQIVTRLFDYPLKKKPFCVYRREDFTSTGEFLGINRQQHVADEFQTDYDKVVKEFNKRLLQKRRENYDRKRRNPDEGLLRKFPGWTGNTVSYLHSLFLMFADEKQRMLDYNGFECILECLGDENLSDIRKNRFNFIDKDGDGFIEYLDYLYIVYNFDTPESERAQGLAKLCVDVSEKIQFVNSLSIGMQLEYGLF